MDGPGAESQADGAMTIGRGVDLTDAVTVFVTTIGAPSFAECMAHLEAQDIVARLEVIEDVAPLPAALQLMIDRCTTRHYVQVDEDMLLDPDAIGRLHGLIDGEWPDVAIVVGLLNDPHLGRPIEGVKIHRHALVRQFPWTGHASVLERNAALESAGYRIARRPIPGTDDRMTFGRHVLDESPTAIFERYRQLERLRRSRPDEIDWFSDYPAEFLRRVLEDESTADFYALMGVIAGNVDDEGRNDGRAAAPEIKDYRHRRVEAAVDAAVTFWERAREIGRPE